MEVRFIRHGKKKALKIYICMGVRGIRRFEITLEYWRGNTNSFRCNNVFSGQHKTSQGNEITKSLIQWVSN